jgi:hypothetical protein
MTGNSVGFGTVPVYYHIPSLRQTPPCLINTGESKVSRQSTPTAKINCSPSLAMNFIWMHMSVRAPADDLISLE